MNADVSAGMWRDVAEIDPEFSSGQRADPDAPETVTKAANS
jgi:hypothetical protein